MSSDIDLFQTVDSRITKEYTRDYCASHEMGDFWQELLLHAFRLS
jgi:hypothetical protein